MVAKLRKFVRGEEDKYDVSLGTPNCPTPGTSKFWPPPKGVPKIYWNGPWAEAFFFALKKVFTPHFFTPKNSPPHHFFLEKSPRPIIILLKKVSAPSFVGQKKVHAPSFFSQKKSPPPHLSVTKSLRPLICG